METHAKILIVEDDAVTARLYQRLLESHGYEVKLAPDGEFAQASLVFEPPDLVLLDLMLPKVPGAEVLHFIRSRGDRKKIPIIVFSNVLQSPMGEAARMEGGGTAQYLSKVDCSPERLLQAVHGALARNRLLEAGPNKSATPARLEEASTPPAPVAAVIATPLTAASPPTVAQAVSPPPSREPGAESARASVTPAQALAAPIPSAPPGLQPVASPSAGTNRIDRNAIEAIRAELRQSFLQDAPPKIAGLSVRLLEISKSKGAPDWPSFLAGFEVSLNTAMVNAGFAGLGRIARFAKALQGLIKDLREEPETINSSTVRTLVSALDFLLLLLQDAGHAPEEASSEPLVLVVDDEPICRSSACVALGAAGMKTISLEDPILALRVLTENRFDCVVTDVDMPETDGYELCKQLRLMRRHKTTPVIFLTGLSDFQSRARSALSGANEFIVKPFTPAELIVKVLILIMKPAAKGKSVGN